MEITAPPPPFPPEGYFSFVVPVLWTETTKALNIIVDLLCAISFQMLGSTGLKKRDVRIKSWKLFWHSFVDLCVTQLWLVVSGVVYSGIEL